MKILIPNALTLCALTSGMYGFVSLLDRNFEVTFYCVVIASTFDLFDGLSARLLGVSSNVGKALDSLSDMVCFGALTSFWLYCFILEKVSKDKVPEVELLAYGALAIAPVVALRLMIRMGRPNSTKFNGLPPGGMSMFLMSLCFLPEEYFSRADVTLIGLFCLEGIVCVLALSFIPFVSMKFSHLRWRGNAARYCLLGFAVLIFLSVPHQYFFLIFIPAYIVLSITVFLCERRHSLD